MVLYVTVCLFIIGIGALAVVQDHRVVLASTPYFPLGDDGKIYFVLFKSSLLCIRHCKTSIKAVLFIS